MGLAFRFGVLDLIGLDVFLVNLSTDLPAADVVGAELLAFVVAVVGVDPASFQRRRDDG